MSEEPEINYEQELRTDLKSAKDRIRGFNNSASVCMTNSLAAATEIHIAICLFRDHAACAHLFKALQSALIVAEVCRQEMGKPSP